MPALDLGSRRFPTAEFFLRAAPRARLSGLHLLEEAFPERHQASLQEAVAFPERHQAGRCRGAAFRVHPSGVRLPTGALPERSQAGRCRVAALRGHPSGFRLMRK